MKTGMTTLGSIVGALASLWAAAPGRAVEAENPTPTCSLVVKSHQREVAQGESILVGR